MVRWQTASDRGRNIGETGKARRIVHGVLAGWIGNRGGQTEGAELGEGVDNAFSKVVVVHAGADADGGLVVRSNDQRQAWREVRVLHGPIGRLAIGLAGRRKGQVRLVGNALGCLGNAIRKPLMGVDGRLNLLAMSFIGRLQKHLADAEGQGRIGIDFPLVLNVPLEFLGEVI